jgi:hypothetical protein
MLYELCMLTSTMISVHVGPVHDLSWLQALESVVRSHTHTCHPMPPAHAIQDCAHVLRELDALQTRIRMAWVPIAALLAEGDGEEGSRGSDTGSGSSSSYDVDDLFDGDEFAGQLPTLMTMQYSSYQNDDAYDDARPRMEPSATDERGGGAGGGDGSASAGMTVTRQRFSSVSVMSPMRRHLSVMLSGRARQPGSAAPWSTLAAVRRSAVSISSLPGARASAVLSPASAQPAGSPDCSPPPPARMSIVGETLTNHYATARRSVRLGRATISAFSAASASSQVSPAQRVARQLAGVPTAEPDSPSRPLLDRPRDLCAVQEGSSAGSSCVTGSSATGSHGSGCSEDAPVLDDAASRGRGALASPRPSEAPSAATSAAHAAGNDPAAPAHAARLGAQACRQKARRIIAHIALHALTDIGQRTAAASAYLHVIRECLEQGSSLPQYLAILVQTLALGREPLLWEDHLWGTAHVHGFEPTASNFWRPAMRPGILAGWLQSMKQAVEQVEGLADAAGRGDLGVADSGDRIWSLAALPRPEALLATSKRLFACSQQVSLPRVACEMLVSTPTHLRAFLRDAQKPVVFSVVLSGLPLPPLFAVQCMPEHQTWPSACFMCFSSLVAAVQAVKRRMTRSAAKPRQPRAFYRVQSKPGRTAAGFPAEVSQPLP